jgi:hypothetical protein
MSLVDIFIGIALLPLVIIGLIIIAAVITSVVQGLIGGLCALLSKLQAAIWRIDESKILEGEEEENDGQVSRMDSE